MEFFFLYDKPTVYYKNPGSNYYYHNQKKKYQVVIEIYFKDAVSMLEVC